MSTESFKDTSQHNGSLRQYAYEELVIIEVAKFNAIRADDYITYVANNQNSPEKLDNARNKLYKYYDHLYLTRTDVVPNKSLASEANSMADMTQDQVQDILTLKWRRAKIKWPT